MRNPQKWGNEPKHGADWAFIVGWIVMLAFSFMVWFVGIALIGRTIRAALSP